MGFRPGMKSKTSSRYIGYNTKGPYNHLVKKRGFNFYFSFFKDNISLLASLVLILGGSSQLITLFNLDPKLLRFFSASQMLVDGLILSIAVISIYLAIKIVYYIEVNYTLLLYGWVLIFFISFQIERITDLWSSKLFLWNIWTMSFFIFLILRHNFKFPDFGNEKPNNKLIKIFTPLVYISGFFFFFGIGYFWFNQINKIFNAEEIGNYAVVKCYMNENYNLNDHYSIKYYNDKFIFIKLEKSSSSEILVFPIDIMFKHELCQNHELACI